MQAKPPLPTFQVLDVAIDAIQLLAPVIARIRRHDRDLGEQLRRALSSVALNAAEGNHSQGGHALHASQRRRAPTPSRAPRYASPSLGATSKRETSRRAKRGLTASRPCCTAWGLAAEPRSSRPVPSAVVSTATPGPWTTAMSPPVPAHSLKAVVARNFRRILGGGGGERAHTVGMARQRRRARYDWVFKRWAWIVLGNLAASTCVLACTGGGKEYEYLDSGCILSFQTGDVICGDATIDAGPTDIDLEPDAKSADAIPDSPPWTLHRNPPPST
jgi:hypothetical protein